MGGERICRRHLDGRAGDRFVDQRRWIISSFGALALAAGAALTSTTQSFSAVSHALADPLSAFADRSPGRRAAGALLQTKSARATDGWRPASAYMARFPSEDTPPEAAAYSALTDNLAPEITAIPESVLPFGLPVDNETAGPLPTAFVAMADTPPAVGGGGPGFTGTPVILFPGGVGITPSPTVVQDNPVIVVPPLGPVSAVPEPSSWTTMITGFLIVGMILRHRKFVARAGSSARVMRMEGVAY